MHLETSPKLPSSSPGRWHRAGLGAACALAFAFAGMAQAHDTGKVHRHQPQRSQQATPLVCGPGQQACRGPFGAQCYSPAAGQACTRGVVCPIGTQACLGRFGASCYSPAAGQACTAGIVCGIGQQACVRPGGAVCYSPAAGERCG